MNINLMMENKKTYTILKQENSTRIWIKIKKIAIYQNANKFWIIINIILFFMIIQSFLL